jgi:hypothetical protein
MLTSAEEFMRLRSSRIKTEYDRSALEEAPIEVWYEVVNEYHDYREWVVHNKTVPLEILEYLNHLAKQKKRERQKAISTLTVRYRHFTVPVKIQHHCD